MVNSYLVNLVIFMKTKKREVQVVELMNCKFGKKTKCLKYSEYLFTGYERFQISNINSRQVFFKWRSLMENRICNLIFVIY